MTAVVPWWLELGAYTFGVLLVGVGLTLLDIRFRMAPRMVEAAIAEYLAGVASSAPRKERTTVGELIEARKADEAS